MKYNFGKGSWPCGKIGPQMSLNWTGQAEIKILSEIFEYPSLSNMWGFLTVFQIIWDTGLCGVGGEGGGSYLAWPGCFPCRGLQDYANANTHPFLCYVARLNSNFQAAQYLKQTYIDDQIFSQPKQQTHSYIWVYLSFLAPDSYWPI